MNYDFLPSVNEENNFEQKNINVRPELLNLSTKFLKLKSPSIQNVYLASGLSGLPNSNLLMYVDILMFCRNTRAQFLNFQQ